MIELKFLKLLILILKSLSKECIICHFQYFLDKGFKFQPYICSECHNVLTSMNLNDIAMLSICGVDYHCIINKS